MNSPPGSNGPGHVAPLPTQRLLIVDDDTELCALLGEYLGSVGFSVAAVHDPEDGILRALSGGHALVVLDVMLPRIDGFEVLRRIRARSSIPVLMLTARGHDIDRIVGLEIGADDYLPKPFNPRELVARIHAVLRRAQAKDGATSPRARLVVGDLDMDFGARLVHCGGREIDLTAAEFVLLEVLLRNAGHVVQREELSRAVLGRGLMPLDRGVDVHVSNLRKKLGPAAGNSERIKTIRGAGYIYVLAADPPGAG